jgi:hypothetical protein
MSERDFLEQTQSRSMGYNGRELTPDEMATEFAKCDIETRVSYLDQIIKADPEDATLRKSAQRMGYTRALLGVHERLRKAGR